MAITFLEKGCVSQSRQSAKLFLQSSELGLTRRLVCHPPPPPFGTGGGALDGQRGGGRVPIPTRGHCSTLHIYALCGSFPCSCIKQRPSLGQCELATQSPDCPSSDSFNMDIQTFIQHQQRDKLPFFSQDDEVNDLVSQMVIIFV